MSNCIWNLKFGRMVWLQSQKLQKYPKTLGENLAEHFFLPHFLYAFYMKIRAPFWKVPKLASFQNGHNLISSFMTRAILGPGFCAKAGLRKVPILLGHPVCRYRTRTKYLDPWSNRSQQPLNQLHFWVTDMLHNW